MRRLVGTLVAVVISVVGVVGLIAFFNSRDESTTGVGASTVEPGTERPATGGSLLEDGNVVLRYADGSFTPRLKELAASLGAPDSPPLRAAGQAVVLRRDARAGGVVAEALEQTLTVRAPDDPRLQAFIERWLGRGASG